MSYLEQPKMLYEPDFIPLDHQSVQCTMEEVGSSSQVSVLSLKKKKDTNEYIYFHDNIVNFNLIFTVLFYIALGWLFLLGGTNYDCLYSHT